MTCSFWDYNSSLQQADGAVWFSGASLPSVDASGHLSFHVRDFTALIIISRRWIAWWRWKITVEGSVFCCAGGAQVWTRGLLICSHPHRGRFNMLLKEGSFTTFGLESADWNTPHTTEWDKKNKKKSSLLPDKQSLVRNARVQAQKNQTDLKSRPVRLPSHKFRVPAIFQHHQNPFYQLH